MEYLFVLLLVLAIYHFIWEGILAPSLRQSLRFELFTCRDDLRRLMIGNNNIQKWTFNHMQGVINTAIDRMHRLDLLALHDTRKEFENNPRLKKQVYEDASRLDREISESGCEELSKLRKKVYFLFASALGVNCGGWIIYIVPLLILAFTYNNLKSLIKAFLYLPVGAVDKITPDSYVHRSI